MAATFPGGVKPFTTKRNDPDGDVVDASHINDLQDEVVAIETELLKTVGSVIDHGSLSGLGDNDHPQYSKTDHVHTEYVKNTGNETISGVKTFSSLPVLPTATPTTNNAIRKGYADNTYVGMAGNQTVGGEKTFSTLPKVPTTTPTSNDQVASKAYVDSVAGGGGGGGGITLQDVYPIGSIYMSMNSTNPATSLGFGTWSAVQGKFLVGVSSETEFNTAGKTGGAKTVTLSTANMPSHNHSISGIGQGALLAPQMGSNADVIVPSGSMSTGYSGSGTAHNNLPPYFAIYIWTRTA